MRKKSLFQLRPVWCLLMALILAILPSFNPCPAAALSLDEFFKISYEPVEFTSTEIQGDEVFWATIRGTATCIKNLPILVAEARITSQVVAEHKMSNAKQILNSSYTIRIDPFPNKKGDTAQINEVIRLQFPPRGESGDYTVYGKLIMAKVKVCVTVDHSGWLDVTDYLPPTNLMGSVTYYSSIAPTQYDLTINIVGQGTTTPNPGTYAYDEGTPVTITATPAGGWEFDHWSGDASGSNPQVTITMDSDKTVTAHFRMKTTYEEQLYEGVNFVSYRGPTVAVTDAVASLPPGALVSVWHFDNQNKKWEVYLPEAPPYASDLERMVHLQPYVIMVTRNCIWSY